MANPYSTQFLQGRGTSTQPATKVYVVPGGFRAVVRSVVVLTLTQVEQACYVLANPGAGDTYLYGRTGTQPWFDSVDMHQVVMAGNKIEAFCSIGDFYVGVGGYLLTE